MIIIFIAQTNTGTMVKRVPQEQMFIIEATLLENHFLPFSGFDQLGDEGSPSSGCKGTS